MTQSQPGSPAAAFGQLWRGANPQARYGELPAPEEGHAIVPGKCTRTVTAGSGFAELLLHPVFVPLEHVFRKLPADGVFVANRQNPFQFEMGALTVPKNMSFLLAEYGFQIFRLNGAVANDAVPLEDRRLSMSVGYDLNFDQFRKGDIQIEIVPIEAPLSNTQAAEGVVTPPVSAGIRPPQVTFPQQVTAGGAVLPTVYGSPGTGLAATVGTSAAMFARAGAHIDAAAAGSALMVQEQKMQGPSAFPFTYKIDANHAVQLRVTVFAPIRIPIAFFEARLGGFVVPKLTMNAMLEGVKPCW